MAETNAKKKTGGRKRATAANTPIPHGSTCGHSGCKDACNVRYCGPTSHPRDHLLHKAAHGASHVWMASVVAGLAIVITMSMAYAAAQAESAPRVNNLNDAVSALWRKMDNMERLLEQIAEAEGVNTNEGSTGMQPSSYDEPAETLFPSP